MLAQLLRIVDWARADVLFLLLRLPQKFDQIPEEYLGEAGGTPQSRQSGWGWG